jgi:hypothetical protein
MGRAAEADISSRCRRGPRGRSRSSAWDESTSRFKQKDHGPATRALDVLAEMHHVRVVHQSTRRTLNVDHALSLEQTGQ